MAGLGKKGIAGGIFEEMMQKFKMMMQQEVFGGNEWTIALT